MSEAAKQQKQIIIDEIKAKLDGAQAAVLIDYMGTTVAEADAMRKMLREEGIDYSVYKNTLMKRAIEGTEFEPLAEAMKGPSAIAISKTDATAPARVLKKSMDQFKKMSFKAGVVEGTYYDQEGIKQVAEIPGKRGPDREVPRKHPVSGRPVRKNAGSDRRRKGRSTGRSRGRCRINCNLS